MVRLDLFTKSNNRKDIRNAIKKQTFDISWSKELYKVIKIRRWVDQLDMLNILIQVATWPENIPVQRWYQPNQVQKIPSIQYGPNGPPKKLPPVDSKENQRKKKAQGATMAII